MATIKTDRTGLANAAINNDARDRLASVRLAKLASTTHISRLQLTASSNGTQLLGQGATVDRSHPGAASGSQNRPTLIA
jgi:hypothetical protein